MSEPESTTPLDDRRFHRYVGNRIPWYVRALWIGFWIFALWYVLRFLIPALQIELGPGR